MKDKRLLICLLVFGLTFYINPLFTIAKDLDTHDQYNDSDVGDQDNNVDNQIRSEENDQLIINLIKLGFSIDQDNPNSLMQAIKNFQMYYGLKKTGVADLETVEKIDIILSSPLQNGQRHEDTIQLKKDLSWLDFTVPGKGTNLYGNATTRKVKEFQAYYGLVVNGIADEVTLSKITELKRGPLYNQMRRQDVRTLKKDLDKLGFTVPGRGTALFGKQTEKKVKEFQAYYGLNVTGTADNEMFAKIEEVLSSPLQNGKRHDDTVQLKKDLSWLDFAVPGIGTNLYGNATTRKVQEFQTYYGLVVNGIADTVTLSKIDELKSGPLYNQMRRQDVKTLKKDLSKLGFAVPGSGTTLFGKQTEKKVKEFQAYYDLNITGIVDKDTFAKIEEILSSPLQNGKRHEDTIQLKKDLSWLDFTVPGSGTNLYGKATTGKVQEFQAYYGLVVNGIADAVTLSKIADLKSGPLYNQMRRQDVKALKIDLDKLGFTVPGKGTALFGKQTEKKVKEFQSYYGLNITGIADEDTFAKIEEILSSPLQNGNRHEDTVQLKKDLARLGFPVTGNGTTLYGTNTTRAVKQFQDYYKLVVNGIADDVTLSKISEILSSPLQNGNRHNDTIQLKKNLSKLDFEVPGNGTNLYGTKTESKVKAFQAYFGLRVNGIADEVTLLKIDTILSSPFQSGKRHKDTIKLKKDLAMLGYKVSNRPTTLFGTKTEKQVKKFQSDHSLKVSGIADSVTLQTIKKEINKFTRIFIDPGHGGKDNGASGFGLREKNVALDIALKAAKTLNTKYKDVYVKLSRESDVFVELEERSKMANEWGADYFISIHSNAHNGKAHGFESFVYNGKILGTTQQRQKKIHEFLIEKLGVTDRGMKRANFNVLRNTNMPALLLEFLFIDNFNENKLLKDPKYRDWLGEITAEAIAIAMNLKKK